jgi:16S rRNA G966 N2-methylase RsmD
MCFTFRDSGTCKYGNDCKFSHGQETIFNMFVTSGEMKIDNNSWQNKRQKETKIKKQKMFITGLPRYGTARHWKSRIQLGFKGAGINLDKIRLGVNSFGHLKGFFHIDVEFAKVEEILEIQTVQVHDETTEQTYSLNISKSVPGKIEMLFPSLTFHQRSQLKFDPTGIFSCTDEYTGDLTTRLTHALCTIGKVDQSNNHYSVLDMFGCVGGNAISFSKLFTNVTSVELDKERSEMLYHNVVKVAGATNVNCIQGDGVEVATSSYHSVIWLDPPWGGVDYTKEKNKLIDDFDIVSNGQSMTMREAILSLSLHTDLIIYRLPNNFDIDSLLDWFVDPCTGLCGHEGGEYNDRPLPFRVRMGHKCTLLLVCLPASRPNRHVNDAKKDKLSFGLNVLDDIVKELHVIDKSLLKELHPKFYDWEQKRSIRLKNWKGVEPTEEK